MTQTLSEEHRVAIATAYAAGQAAKGANTPERAAAAFQECYSALGEQPKPDRPKPGGPRPSRANSNYSPLGRTKG